MIDFRHVSLFMTLSPICIAIIKPYYGRQLHVEVQSAFLVISTQSLILWDTINERHRSTDEMNPFHIRNLCIPTILLKSFRLYVRFHGNG